MITARTHATWQCPHTPAKQPSQAQRFKVMLVQDTSSGPEYGQQSLTMDQLQHLTLGEQHTAAAVAYQEDHTQIDQYQDNMYEQTDYEGPVLQEIDDQPYINQVSAPPNHNSIPIRKIQNIEVLINGKVAQLSLDSGCVGNTISLVECHRLGLDIKPLNEIDARPNQADGQSPLKVVGKVTFMASRGDLQWTFIGYVSTQLSSPILCGAPFLVKNEIVQELSQKRILASRKHYILETSLFCPNPTPSVLKAAFKQLDQIIPPGAVIQVHLPESLPANDLVLVSTQVKDLQDSFPPSIIKAEDRTVAFENKSPFYLCSSQIPAFTVAPVSLPNILQQNKHSPAQQPSPQTYFNKAIIGEGTHKNIKNKLFSIHKYHASVFDEDLTQGYN